MKARIVFYFLALFMFSCQDKNNVSEKGQTLTFEVLGKDTCNRIVNGQKQGAWYLFDSIEWKAGNRHVIDTVFYKDGIVVGS
ncbi:MAG: hypothetical protein K0S32_961 [Bacteroidetes bacterium]|jgi:hypothetical protein|nr:hypothetical protein [Bacteroidota bacterium]